MSALLCLTLLAAGGFTHPRLQAYRSFCREPAETAAFAELGVPLRAIGICNTASGRGVPYSDYPPVWLGPGQYDWACCDRQFDDVLAASPEATFMVLVDLNSPLWLARRQQFDSFTAIVQAAAMPEWREAVKEYLRALVGHVEAKYGPRIVAYVPMAGRTTEWYDVDVGLSSRAKNAAWRDWCAKRGLAYREFTPPETELARAAFENVLYDPATEREKIDYLRFHNGIVADAILEMAGAIRSLVGPAKEIGVFFGYYCIDGRNLSSQGHMDYERVMASPDIDFAISPATYRERACGFGTGSQSVTGTLRRYGKRLVHEIDFWPHDLKLPWRSAARNYFHSAADDVAGNMRDAVFAFVNGCSWWYFDQYGGYYRTPGMHERIAALAKIERRFAREDPPSVADILFVADPQSALLIRDPPGMTAEGFAPMVGATEILRNRLNVIGCAYEVCSFGDLAHLDLGRFRLIVLPATYEITPERAELLRGKVCVAGRTVLWTYAPGISDGRGLDIRRVEDWTGVPFRTKGVTTTAMPGGWTSVCAYDYRALDAAAVRAIAVGAGAFLYADEPMPVAANGRFLAVHCAKGGAKTFRVPFRCRRIVDLFADRVVAEGADAFAVTLESPDTRLYELERE